VEFLSDYFFRIHFLVRGIPDSFTNLQNLIHARACLYPDLPRPESGPASGPQLRGKIKHPKSQIQFPHPLSDLSGLCVSKNPRVSVSCNRGAKSRRLPPPCHNSPLRLPSFSGDPLRKLGFRLKLKLLLIRRI
jgi:hypothetical protein